MKEEERKGHQEQQAEASTAEKNEGNFESMR